MKAVTMAAPLKMEEWCLSWQSSLWLGFGQTMVLLGFAEWWQNDASRLTFWPTKYLVLAFWGLWRNLLSLCNFCPPPFWKNDVSQRTFRWPDYAKLRSHGSIVIQLFCFYKIMLKIAMCWSIANCHHHGYCVQWVAMFGAVSHHIGTINCPVVPALVLYLNEFYSYLERIRFLVESNRS